MDLNTLWFILIATLYTGYFILEGFDFGVGMLLPFITKDNTTRRVILNSIGPHWDGNEVWLIAAGGATFAAFPLWYATLFSGFYIPLFLMLVALIFRGVAFEFRSKINSPRWYTIWDWTIFAGSIIPAFLWGVTFANFLMGVPIDMEFNYSGGFWNLLNSFSILGGLISTVGFVFHGALFLVLKMSDSVLNKVRKIAQRTWLPAFLLLLLAIMNINFTTSFFTRNYEIPFYLAIVSLAILGAAGILNSIKKDKIAFLCTSLAILFTIATIFAGLYPIILPASDGINHLTIYNAASGEATLKTMSIISLILVPIIIVYQAWSYWVFRKKITNIQQSDTNKLEY